MVVEVGSSIQGRLQLLLVSSIGQGLNFAFLYKLIETKPFFLVFREKLCHVDTLTQTISCDKLINGLAELGTMCESKSSCSLVYDNGLSSAFTIAHELGHV